ncbi:MAG: hypothetical protein GX827_09195 [Clostridiales bacterium]|jgi:hypothetical protein|nr:hypothetical protein [Clostridiales bacterium]
MATIDLARVTAQAARYGAALGADLKLRMSDLENLDRMLLSFSKENFDRNKKAELTFIFGIYVGQTLISCELAILGFGWSDSPMGAILTNGRDFISPLSAVSLRLEGQGLPLPEYCKRELERIKKHK